MEQQVKKAWGCFKKGLGAFNMNQSQVVSTILDYK